MTQTFTTLTIDVDPRGVATLTLNRPQVHNALNEVLISDMRRAAAQLADDNAVRVVVLTGAGKSFCAGGDIKWFAKNIDRTRNQRIDESGELAKMLHELDRFPKPLIGRVNGPAYGGGVGMISVCDLTVGVDTARFGLTEVRLGLIPANISPYVVARIGAANSRATMLSGALFDGQRAYEMGLLTHVVTADSLDKKVEDIISDHLEAAPGAVAATKRLIEFVAANDIDANMAYTAQALADAWETTEGQTGVSTFLNKKLPPWRSGA